MSRRDIDYAEERIRSAFQNYVTNWVTPFVIAGIAISALSVVFLVGCVLLMWLWR